MAAPATEHDTTTPELPDTERREGLYSLSIPVTQQDPELRAIEVALQVLEGLPYPTRVRAMTYLKDRIESDPAVWGPSDPGPAMVAMTRREVAQILATADEYDWATMTPAAQAPYYQRAEALTTAPFVVERIAT